MWKNIGNKIKAVAKFNCWAGMLSSVILAIVLFSLASQAYDEDSVTLTLLGFVILIAGFLLSWVSSFVLYGFGQLVQNSDKLAGNNPTSSENSKTTNASSLSKPFSIDKIPVNTPISNKAPSNTSVKEEKPTDLKSTYKQWRDTGVITEEEYNSVMEQLF